MSEISRRGTITALMTVAMVVGCGGKVVSTAEFDDDGHASMEIEKTRWDGQTLWIAFEMECPYKLVEGIGHEEDWEAVYHFEGTFVMKNGEYVYNDDTLYLSSTKFPVHNSSGSTFVRSGGSCSNATNWCTYNGRIRVLNLDHIEPGTKLQIEATLPDTAGEAKLHKAELQFRSK